VQSRRFNSSSGGGGDVNGAGDGNVDGDNSGSGSVGCDVGVDGGAYVYFASLFVQMRVAATHAAVADYRQFEVFVPTTNKRDTDDGDDDGIGESNQNIKGVWRPAYKQPLPPPSPIAAQYGTGSVSYVKAIDRYVGNEIAIVTFICVLSTPRHARGDIQLF
jgi:hypothetical protein